MTDGVGWGGACLLIVIYCSRVCFRRNLSFGGTTHLPERITRHKTTKQSSPAQNFLANLLQKKLAPSAGVTLSGMPPVSLTELIIQHTSVGHSENLQNDRTKIAKCPSKCEDTFKVSTLKPPKIGNAMFFLRASNCTSLPNSSDTCRHASLQQNLDLNHSNPMFPWQSTATVS